MRSGRRLKKEDARKAATWRAGTMALRNPLTIKASGGQPRAGFRNYFNIGPVEMSGSSTSIKQTSTTLGPSLRFVADLGNWDGSLNNVDIGQSRANSVAALQRPMDAYYVGRSFRCSLTRCRRRTRWWCGHSRWGGRLDRGRRLVGVCFRCDGRAGPGVRRGRRRRPTLRDGGSGSACLARCL